MYQRIVILGGSGSGKSTLANIIASHTGYPVYHLDNLLLNLDHSPKDKSQWEEISKIFLSKDVGIVDGNFNSTIPNRIRWSDLVIFIHVSTATRLYRILKRFIRVSFGLEHRHGSLNLEKSKERLTIKWLLWAYNWNRHRGKELLLNLKSLKDKKVIIINDPYKFNLKELSK